MDKCQIHLAKMRQLLDMTSPCDKKDILSQLLRESGHEFAALCVEKDAELCTNGIVSYKELVGFLDTITESRTEPVQLGYLHYKRTIPVFDDEGFISVRLPEDLYFAFIKDGVYD